VPVDTHVHQIALKHYGLKSTSRGKATMTPKLYEELSAKFFSIWGDYAGWAHCVSFRLLYCFYKIIHLFPQVLFTADLKSFSSYGLEPPPLVLPSDSPTRTEKRTEKHPPPVQSVVDLQTPPVTPSTSPLKRKWDPEIGDHVEISPENMSELCLEVAESWNIADQVKKRRRC
jgi:N-glycosylase/DNA lyase